MLFFCLSFFNNYTSRFIFSDTMYKISLYAARSNDSICKRCISHKAHENITLFFCSLNICIHEPILLCHTGLFQSMALRCLLNHTHTLVCIAVPYRDHESITLYCALLIYVHTSAGRLAHALPTLVKKCTLYSLDIETHTPTHAHTHIRLGFRP